MKAWLIAVPLAYSFSAAAQVPALRDPMRRRMSSGFMPGLIPRTSAAVPANSGAAIDVPLQVP